VSWNYHWAAGAHPAQPRYNQFPFGGCAVGCGPVAWAMLFCWADRQAETGNAYWAPRTGIYRENGGRASNAVAPIAQDGGVNNVITEIRGQVGTFCASGSGATFPWGMMGAWLYLNGRSNCTLQTNWNSWGIRQNYLRDLAVISIVYRQTPTIIGTGWFVHYPLAFGYAWQQRTVRHCFLWWCWNDVATDRSFYINNGWGGGGTGEWITASTWFAGQIYP
jgi:hypothetical protein